MSRSPLAARDHWQRLQEVQQPLPHMAMTSSWQQLLLFCSVL
jgi:hypothetical protein